MTTHLMRPEGSPEPELIADYACETGENPLWHPLEKRLYWTDIPNGRLFRYNPNTGHHEEIYQGRSVGGFTFEADGGLLLFRDRGNVALWRDGEFVEIVGEIAAELDSRFNDVIADPAGRVFCGTMSSEHSKGSLYRLDLDGRITQVLDSIGCSNGMGFSPDLKTLYYTDSFAREIYCFDYDIETGSLANRRVFATIPESDGFPDGLAVDQEGRVWSALWDGFGLVRFNQDGNIANRVQFPTRKVSSLTFGGEDLQDISVTTAGGNTKPEDGEAAGSLFRIRLGAIGRLEFLSRIASRGTSG
jgi:D-xylono/L-arabinono-1,4-lactonase